MVKRTWMVCWANEPATLPRSCGTGMVCNRVAAGATVACGVYTDIRQGLVKDGTNLKLYTRWLAAAL